ncbi:MAG: hypothetical protein AAFR61_11610 [Bacteroidota bacterium]
MRRRTIFGFYTLVCLIFLSQLAGCRLGLNLGKKTAAFSIPHLSFQGLDRGEALEVNWRKNAHYFPYYFGKVVDSLEVVGVLDSSAFDAYFDRFDGYFFGLDDPIPYYPLADTLPIEILVDTAQIIYLTFQTWLGDYDIWIQENIQAFPVWVRNMHLDSCKLGYGNDIWMVLEAKDPDGHWRPIEEPASYPCGFGLPDIVLPSQEIILTACPIHEGPFETNLRLRMGQNFSNEFSGRIQLTQFESIYNELGELKIKLD